MHTKLILGGKWAHMHLKALHNVTPQWLVFPDQLSEIGEFFTVDLALSASSTAITLTVTLKRALCGHAEGVPTTRWRSSAKRKATCAVSAAAANGGQRILQDFHENGRDSRKSQALIPAWSFL